MSPRSTVVALVVLAAALAAPASAARAGGGGGCYAGMTSGRGSTVELIDICFTPNILRVLPGTEVTFVNRDTLPHNVYGPSLFYELKQGRAFTATFEDEGVYPFACYLHPGMAGAIVVGDGLGAANAPVDVRELVPPSPEVVVVSSEPEIRTVTRTVERASPAGWLLGGTVGLAAGAALGAISARVRRRRRAAAPG